MDAQSVSFVAGAISSFMFISSHVPMLLKAFRTRDLHSYSFLHLLLVNAGNLLYWLYIFDLPPGPIWLMHTFYTLSSALLLGLYLFLSVGQPRNAALARTIYIPTISLAYIVTYRRALKRLINLIRPAKIWRSVKTECATGLIRSRPIWPPTPCRRPEGAAAQISG